MKSQNMKNNQKSVDKYTLGFDERRIKPYHV